MIEGTLQKLDPIEDYFGIDMNEMVLKVIDLYKSRDNVGPAIIFRRNCKFGK